MTVLLEAEQGARGARPTSGGRILTNPVPPAFGAQLAAAFPRMTNFSWLMARWEPGDEWEPIERWVIWEVHPWHLLDPADVAALKPAMEGPNPRSTGHYCAAGLCPCAIKRNRWTGGVHEGADYHRQWQVYQELRAAGTVGFPMVVWLVQGEHGGHPPRMDQIEKQMAAVAGLPREFPELGALPYAPLDGRVIHGLLARDRMRDAKGVLRERYRTGAELASDEAERAQQAADQVFEWIMARTHDAAAEAAHVMKKIVGNTIQGRHGEPVVFTDREALKERFIEETAIVRPD